jgi:hypothetical protein
MRAKQEAIEERECDCIQANAQDKNEQERKGKLRRSSHHPEAVPQVVAEYFELMDEIIRNPANVRVCREEEAHRLQI